MYRVPTSQDIEDHQLKDRDGANFLTAFGIRNKWLNLYPIANKSSAKEAIKLNHYSHTVPMATGATFGIFHMDNTAGKADGYIMLGNGIRPLKKNTWGEDINSDNAMEIDRMWLSDEMPRNSESMALAAMIKYLKKFTSIKYLISYSDGSVGNCGVIYKAANFHYDGAIKADFYILADGSRVHPVSMWHRHGTRKKEILENIYPGIIKAKGVQHRFIYKVK